MATLESGQDFPLRLPVTEEPTEARPGEATCPKPHSRCRFYKLTPLASAPNSQGDTFPGSGGGRAGGFWRAGTTSTSRPGPFVASFLLGFAAPGWRRPTYPCFSSPPDPTPGAPDVPPLV